MRTERKRKMGKDARYVFVTFYFPMTITLVTASTIERKKEKRRQRRLIMKLFAILIDKPFSQPMVLPQYQGPSADSVEAESELFEGMKFSE